MRAILPALSVLALALALSLTGQQTVNGGRTTLGPVDNSGATHTLSFKVVANTGALPATGCTPGEMAVVTGATLGQQIYQNSGTGACVWTQQLNTGSNSGGGISVYSATALTVTAGTYYFPIGGGGSPSTTETNVDIDSPAAATITNFYVQLSVALGMGNSGVLTLRKNATSQSVTCTISGASATTCNDTTHSFNVSQGDLLTVQLVTTGTIVVTPNVMFAMQFGNITASGTVNTGTAGQVVYYAANGSAVSGASVTGAVKAGNPPTQAACADLSNAAATCSSPASSGITGAVVPPYLAFGGNKYVAATGYQATVPAVATYLNSVTPTNSTTGANGDLLISGAGNVWGSYTATTSVEAEFEISQLNTAGTNKFPQAGIWLHDTTNNTIWAWDATIWTGIGTSPCSNNCYGANLNFANWTYNNTGNPAFSGSTNQVFFQSNSGVIHLKLAVAAGTMTASLSLDGGATFTIVTTKTAIGTIDKGGYNLAGDGTNGGVLDVLSLVVN